MVIQLALNLGTAYAATPATDVLYRIVSGSSTVRVARTNAGVRADGNGCFSADVDIDPTWHPCRVIWDGPATGDAAWSVSEPISFVAGPAADADAPDVVFENETGVILG